jgi:hypothetical protein
VNTLSSVWSMEGLGDAVSAESIGNLPKLAQFACEFQ